MPSADVGISRYSISAGTIFLDFAISDNGSSLESGTFTTPILGCWAAALKLATSARPRVTALKMVV